MPEKFTADKDIQKKSPSAQPFAVVTGASSGIGLELAKEFARHGYDLLVAAEDPGIGAAAKKIGKEGKVTVEPLQVDLAQYEGVEELYAKIRSLGRPVDAIALNAGVGVSGDFTRETELKAELNLIDLNVSSTVHLAKRVIKDMVERGEGRVLITSSVVSQLPGSLMAIYSASKAFLQSFAQAIRNELKDTGVTVTALMPGATETNFFHRAGMDDTKVGQAKKDDPAEVAKQGFKALMAGKDHVVGGSFLNRVQVAAAKIIPEPMKAELNRKQAEPASGKRSRKAKESKKKAA